jgi:hypothetical protein
MMINVEKIPTIDDAKFFSELEILKLLDTSDIGKFRERCLEHFSIASSYLTRNIQPSEEFASEVVKFVSIAYLGGKRSSLRQFFQENEKLVNSIAGFAEINSWNDNKTSVLFSIVYAVILFLNGKYDAAVLQVRTLRILQKEYEAEYLESVSKEERRLVSLELLSLYFFARAVEMLSYLALHSLDKESIGIKRLIKFCINNAQEWSRRAGNATIEMALIFFDRFVSSIIEKRIFTYAKPIN